MIFFSLYNHANIMFNMYILKNIKDRKNLFRSGYWLNNVYEQELEKKIKSIIKFNSEINDFSEKLVNKYNK